MKFDADIVKSYVPASEPVARFHATWIAQFCAPPALMVRGEFSASANPAGNPVIVIVETSELNATTMMSPAATEAGTANFGVLVVDPNRVPIVPNAGADTDQPPGLSESSGRTNVSRRTKSRS
jgi:hypothetical protein